MKRRWQISRMAPSSLASRDTSRSSSPTASTSSSTDSKSAPLPCRIPAGTRRRRCRDGRPRVAPRPTGGGSRPLALPHPSPPLPGRAVATAGQCRDTRRGGRPSRGEAGAAHPSRKRRPRRPGRGTRCGGCRRRTPWRSRSRSRSGARPRRGPVPPHGARHRGRGGRDGARAGAAGKEAGGRHARGGRWEVE